ncbi:site-specific DNA-methyltransferase [Luteibacter flocculans]|uniref:Methyltransferase n=1 Tax=Luteibacter flocculans TaxID=2780091 RepID=A0ABY4T3V7_9GAMM|nr:site-specific DNA-methyltransferase [Luteibacter flocculans]URL59588.1 site-specific DNA-methyltransferase [Luteibacter flocculans]
MTMTHYLGDCLEVMRSLPSDSVDAVVTDPPYELGFMGKAWDKSGIAFQVEVWAEVLRLAKPGAFLLAFGGTRTVHRLTCAIEDAGWEIRDSIMWIYGQGFPKSKNGKWGGTACKPAHEPIVMARKPFDGTVAENFAKWGTGGLNIDGCRVEWPGGQPPEIGTPGWGGPSKKLTAAPGQIGETVGRTGPSDLGRWPANVIHDGADEVLAAFPEAPGQQGDLRGQSRKRVSRGIYGDMPVAPDALARKDSGSAARFFYCAKASTKDREAGLDDFERSAAGMVSNTSGQHITRREAGRKLPKRANTHPTVKPTELMRYLCQLVTPFYGTRVVLDPFEGSGSTGRGAALNGFDYIGIDDDPNHIAIARARGTHAERAFDAMRQQAMKLRETA